ncbi:MAG: alkene reductase [Phycisphaeraceae bacterium]|nr:MAG: alkene reductase [Phycisphaeraceae bacterium]
MSDPGADSSARTGPLMSPLRVGVWDLPHRVAMAPLTRCRAGPGRVPTPLNAEYYRQRASACFIVSEATQVSEQGIGYPDTPGVHTPAQVAGWRPVTEAVRREGGRILAQLWHCGRVSHPDFQPGGALPVSSSAVSCGGEARTPAGKKPRPVPRALEIGEIPGIVDQYRRGAANALEAGFDGVEIHAANGYLIDQFIRDGCNRRTDAYGGPVDQRLRFLREVTEAVVGVVGPGRVGVRLSPTNSPGYIEDSEPESTFTRAAETLAAYPLAYLHVLEGLPGTPTGPAAGRPRVVELMRRVFPGVMVLNSGYGIELAAEQVRSGVADVMAFGVAFIANPDLPERIRAGAPLNTPNPGTFYTPGPVGYTDYPRWTPA